MDSGKEGFPSVMVVDTRDLMQQLKHETANSKLTPTDYREIMTQVIDLLLNFGRRAKESYPLLPDVSRLYDQDMDRNQETWLLIQSACFRFAVAVEAYVESLGAFRRLDSGHDDFPYVIYGWRGDDLVLEYLPF